MNLILLFKQDFLGASSLARVSGRRFEYIRDVHRAQPGDLLTVGLLNGNMGKGRVCGITDSDVEMEVTLSDPPPPPLPVKIVLALPRPKVIKRVILSLTSLGVKEIHLVHAFRVEKSYWQSPVLSPETLDHHLILGLEQAKDTILPRITITRYFKPFVEDRLPEIIKGTRPILAHPQAEAPCPRHVDTPVTLIVGPEGGFIPYEIDKLQAAGAVPVRLGPRILRVETALPTILARLF